MATLVLGRGTARGFRALAMLLAIVACIGATHGLGSPPPRYRPPPPRPAASAAALLANRSDCRIAAAAVNVLPPIKAALANQGSVFTLFVPNDTAFQLYMQVLGVDQAGLLALGPRLLSYLLDYHYVPNVAIASASIRDRQALPTALEGYNVTVSRSGSDVFVTSPSSRARVVRADLRAGRAIVHVVDRVLVPFDLFAAPPVPLWRTLGDLLREERLGILAEAMQSAGLGYIMGRTDIVGTLFAPTDQAFFTLSYALFARASVPAVWAALGRTGNESAAAAMLIGDHAHIGETLLARDLAARSSLAVGLDVTAYSQPGAATLLVRADRDTGLISLSAFTSATLIQEDLLVGAAGRLAVHVVDGVLMSYKTAAALGLLLGGGGGGGVPSTMTPTPGPGPAPSPGGGSAPPSATYASLGAAMAAEPELSALRDAATGANLTSVLAALDSPLTIFAPSSAAFARLAAVLRAVDPRLMEAAGALLANVLADHVHLGAALPALQLRDGQAIPVGLDPAIYDQPTATRVLAHVNSSGIFVDLDMSEARVLRTIRAGPAVINIIDTVLISGAMAARLGMVAGGGGMPPQPASSALAPSGAPSFPSLPEALAAIPQLSQLMGLATPMGLAGSNIPLTLFAPTNEAFMRMAAILGDRMPPAESAALIATVLADHVHLGEALPASMFTDGQQIPVGTDRSAYSLPSATKLLVTRNATGIFVSAGSATPAAQVLRNITAGPAVINIIDMVLVSDAVAARLGMAAGGSPVPVPAPVPAPVQVPVEVPMPVPSSPAALPAPSSPAALPAPEPVTPGVIMVNAVYPDIVEALRATGNANSLIALYNAARASAVGAFLVDYLRAPYTLFAPTDEAFEAYLTASGTTLSALTADPIRMGMVLLPHLVLGQAIPFEGLSDGQSISAGSNALMVVTLRVSRSGSLVRLSTARSQATILRSGIAAGPAQVHVIDTVLQL